jgi:hypothetical protein
VPNARTTSPGPGALSGAPPLTPDDVASAISVATRAPSIHNTQPWRFRPRPEGIELLADPDRLLPAVDPDGRELLISCGAALFGLRLGLRRLGRLPAVTLLPDPTHPLLTGWVWSAGRAALTTAETDLITAVPHRHTHRGPFTPGEVPPRLLAALQSDAAAEGCELVLMTNSQEIARLSRLVRLAAAQQRANPAVTTELARWVRSPGSEARDGVPAFARLAGDGQEGAVMPAGLPTRQFGLAGTEAAGSQPPAATAVLVTARDTPSDWLRAGQALDRILLRAAARWVFARLQSQPLESLQLRLGVRALVGGAYPQLLLEFGRSNTAPATPRRPQAEVLATEPRSG